MRTFALAPVGFAHPNIAVYATRPPRAAEAPALFLPRPYDHTWNGGVAFLDPGPYDRDDRTVFLGGAQVHDVTLAGPAAVDEVVVFLVERAAGEPGPRRGRVASRRRPLAARRVARPPLPAAVAVAGPPRALPRAGRPPARGTQRAGPDPGRGPGDRRGVRRMGTLGRLAVPYLERALAARPRRRRAPPPARHGCIAGSAGRRTRGAWRRLETEAPGYAAAILHSSARPRSAAAETWRPAFERLTGLDAALLVARAHAGGARRRAPCPGPAGRRPEDCSAPSRPCSSAGSTRPA